MRTGRGEGVEGGCGLTNDVTRGFDRTGVCARGADGVFWGILGVDGISSYTVGAFGVIVG